MKIKFGIGVSFLCVLLVSTIGLLKIQEQKEGETIEKVEDKEWAVPKMEESLEDRKALYDDFTDTTVEKVYVTVLPPKSELAVDFTTLHTSVNLTNDVYHNDSEDPLVDIYFSTAPEQVPGDEGANGTLEIRGQSSRRMPQKSYKIKLNDDSDPWHGLYTLNLNKHYADPLRIRNKLSFDYFKLIEGMVSYRTKFVELYIKDQPNSKTNDVFQSYGLFTFIEQPNKNFLKDHGLDPSGHFYKAEYFEFYRYEDAIKVKEDPAYTYEAFESILETRGNEDHSKLIEMLEAVNDYSRSINEVVDTYFDEDNMLTWLAVNILMNNYDTSSRNFMLYSPVYSEKWYFIPWDYDKSWEKNRMPETSWQSGLANYWGMVLFNRYFKYPENVEALNQRIEEVAQIITPETTEKLLKGYYNQTFEIIHRQPDFQNLKLTEDQYRLELEKLLEVPYYNKERYYEELERPMPFFLWEYRLEEMDVVFEWDSAFDLQGEQLKYEFWLSKTPDFGQVIAHQDDIYTTEHNVGMLHPGTYYWKVVAKDTSGHTRNAFTSYIDDSGRVYEGVGMVKIP